MLEFEPLPDPRFSFMKPNQDFIERWYERQGPYRVAINSAGFRDNELRHPDGFKIFVVGDSMTFGAGVEFHDTYVDRLEQKARSAFPLPSVEVINAGQAGATIDSETAVLVHKGLPLRPQIAILAFFANDVADISRVGRDQQVYKQINLPFKRHMRQTALYIQLYKLKLYGLRQLYERKTNEAEARQPVMATESAFYAPRLSSLWQERWETYLARLGEFITVCRRSGVQPVLLIIPEAYQVENSGLTPQPQLILGAAAQSYGVPVVDPLPRFREAFERGRRLYIPNDGHLRPEGHEIIAEALFGELWRGVEKMRGGA
jgi:hypothetical protein